MKTRRITLETHLHKIAEYDETVKNLESVFNIQKQKVIRYIGSVVTSFPTYSTHDAVHSMNIISAIEKILGQKTIKKMSGIDTFLILMCAYMHDTGMLYSDEEVKQLWETEGFQDFLTSARKREDEVGRAARKIDKAEKGEGCSVLEVRRSVAVILMEYFRPRHGQRIKHVTDARTSEFGSLLSIDDSFLPDRIIHNIYRISMAHNWSFEDILKEMPLADSFGVEEFHPRMVAYLIRMGDLCDMDNNRFNGVGIKVFGNLGEENLAHYFKHKSVETLHISSDGIVVVAKGYVAMIGMEEYPMLGIENAEEQYHAQIGMLAKYPEIPLWDYGAGIKAFMDQFIGCPIDEKSQEIIDRIINSEGGKAVIHYIAVYRKKTGDDVKEEKIETQYREFLKELIYCWADGRCTFG